MVCLSDSGGDDALASHSAQLRATVSSSPNKASTIGSAAWAGVMKLVL